VQSLAQLGITAINLTADSTEIELPDGSKITGRTTYTKGDGSTGTIANTSLAAEVQGFAVTQTITTDGSGNRVVVSQCYDAQGALAHVIKSVTSPSGNAITNSYDDTGDGVYDRVQTIAKSTDGAGIKTELLSNFQGSDVATGILENRQQTVTSADGRAATDAVRQKGPVDLFELRAHRERARGRVTITISQDSASAATWHDQREVRDLFDDSHRSVMISANAANDNHIASKLYAA
jgi:hypothetical protein